MPLNGRRDVVAGVPGYPDAGVVVVDRGAQPVEVPVALTPGPLPDEPPRPTDERENDEGNKQDGQYPHSIDDTPVSEGDQ